jgi:two-component system phosphate regulon response regulator PhoB
MSVLRRTTHTVAAPVVLVVDDDPRVLELLEIAFESHGFKVVKAADGDAAIHRIAAERPDLMVMDVRLPKKSGIEVLEILRRDPTDAQMPVIVISGTSDTDARLRAFTSGADDFVAKPFSPKELIARMRRLLARTAEARAAEGRSATLEQDLQRVRNDAQHAHAGAAHERRLREAMIGPGGELLRTLDLDQVCDALLLTLQIRAGIGTAALLLHEPSSGRLEPRAIRGDGFERLEHVRLGATGGVAEVVSGLGRLVPRSELDGLRELRDELQPLIAAGFALLAPLRGPEGLIGLLLAEAPHDGRALDRAESEEVMVLCELAAIAAGHARCVAGQAEDLARALAHEAREIVRRAATAAHLAPRRRELLALALELGLPEQDLDALAAIERHAPGDPTGRLAELLELERLALGPLDAPDERPGARRAALLLFVARRYVRARDEGAEPGEALTAAGVEAGEALDPVTALALNGALREYA